VCWLNIREWLEVERILWLKQTALVACRQPHCHLASRVVGRAVHRSTHSSPLRITRLDVTTQAAPPTPLWISRAAQQAILAAAEQGKSARG
jgi:hypothetical protein